MREIIHLNDQYSVLVTSAMVDDRTRVLKQGESFAVFDRYGDIQPILKSEHGLYFEGTRFLSRLELLLDHERPMLLSSTLKADHALLRVDLTNADLYVGDELVRPRGTVHLLRTKFLWEGACCERLRVSNFGVASVVLSLAYPLEADYADIFEVRGKQRARRGRRLPEVIDEEGLHVSYEGLDGVVRRTHISCSPKPSAISPSEIEFEIRLEPKEEATFFLTISCDAGGRTCRRLSNSEAFIEARDSLQAAEADNCLIETSNEQFNEWLTRSIQDVHLMVTETSEGPYPYAGVPWFSAPFGRDGIITALEYLWVNPKLARGVLAYLASTQAEDVNPEQDAEPGKILHESRKGEMAVLGEIPFRRYYGSVDSTPLFIVLAGTYYRATGDLAFMRSLWPHVRLALEWLDRYGDRDGDGFVEHFRHSQNGLVHQGWKDSHAAVFHGDGPMAEGPSRSAKSRATPTKRNVWPRSWRWRWARGIWPKPWPIKRRRSKSGSRRPSGARTCPCMRLPWTVTSGRVRC